MFYISEEDPDIVRTREMHERATQLCDEAYFSPIDDINEFVVGYITAKQQAIGIDRLPCLPVVKEVLTAIQVLYETERFKVPPRPFSPEIGAGIEGARFRDELSLVIRRHEDSKETLRVWRNTLGESLYHFFDALPPFAVYEGEQSFPAADAMTVPLIESMENVPLVVERMISAFTDDRRELYGLFDALYDRLYENVKRISAREFSKVSDVVLPTKSKLPPIEIVREYFYGTPLSALFFAKVPFKL